MSRVSWCQGGSLQESVSTLSEVEGRVSHPPPPSFGPRKLAGPKAIPRMSAPSLPLVPYSFLAPRLPRTSPVKTDLTLQGFSLPHPHPATRPTSALKGHPPLAPGVPAQVGEQCWPPGLCFVRPSYPAVMVTSSTDLVHGGHRHTHRHPTPPWFPGPSLPPCLVVKTLTLRGPDTQSRACRYLVSLPETWGLFF